MFEFLYGNRELFLIFSDVVEAIEVPVLRRNLQSPKEWRNARIFFKITPTLDKLAYTLAYAVVIGT